ncbi:MAG: Mor transcription activator family protein [Syntrophorhabdales bacterium]
MVDEHAFDNISGDFRRVAALIGNEAALVLCDHFGGLALNIPKLAGFRRNQRNERIKADYHAGVKVRTLATRYRLTIRQIYSIIKGE